jgi:hypothetical protein
MFFIENNIAMSNVYDVMDYARQNVQKYLAICVVLVILGLILIMSDFIAVVGWILLLVFVWPAIGLFWAWFNLS